MAPGSGVRYSYHIGCNTAPMIYQVNTMTTIYTSGIYSVCVSSQVNAWNPYYVINLDTGKRLFSTDTLALCMDYVSDVTR